MMHALHQFLFLHILIAFEQNALGSEIIDGKKTKKRSMLYMASVQKNGHHVCGGFLVSEDFVLTAAHCDVSSALAVVLGTTNLKKVDNDTMRYSVKKCKHPSYVNSLSGHDIMLLKLSRKAKLSKVSIKPIQLPSHQIKLKENEKCTVAGWGYTKTNGNIVDDLQEVKVPIINREKCQQLWQNTLPANIICAGGYDTHKGFCQGDSGGPLVCKGVAVGIVSFNNNFICDYPDVPNTYTDISKYLTWIKKVVKAKQC